MFGMFGTSGIVQRVEEAKSLPKRKVTAAEFRRRALRAGWSEEEVTKQTKLAKAFDSHVRVGNELLKLAAGKEQ